MFGCRLAEGALEFIFDDNRDADLEFCDFGDVGRGVTNLDKTLGDTLRGDKTPDLAD